MDKKIIILITEKHLQAMKQKDEKWILANISGHSVTAYTSDDDLKNFVQEIKDSFNITNFKSDMSILLVKCGAKAKTVFKIEGDLKNLESGDGSAFMNEQANINVIDARYAVLLATAMKTKIKKDSCLPVNVLDMNYVINVNDESIITCDISENKNDDAIKLDAKDFGVIFSADAKLFGADEEEVGKLKDENGKLKKDNGKLKNEIAELKDEKAEMKNKLAETDKQLAETKKQLDVFLKKEEETIEKKNFPRTICYVPKFENNGSYTPLAGIFGSILATQNGATRTLYKSDGSYITKNQVIATIEIGTTKKEIKAPRDGKVFYLKNDESLKGSEAFAIIGDENDTREDVMAWYKNHKS